MRAAIMSIGSEILSGHLLDTNSQYFAQELNQLGVDIVRIVQLPDNQEHIASALRALMSIAGIVVTTGGLGPTADDLTREAIADVADEALRIDPDALRSIEHVLASRGHPMPERNRKQAWVIDSATIVPNLNGTAPGWIVELGRTTIVALPGPPRENRRMWSGPVIDRLRRRLDARIIASRTIKTIGIGESSVEDALEDIVQRTEPITATYAKSDGVHIRVTGAGDDATTVESLIETTMAEIRTRIGQHIYGVDDESLAEAIMRPIRDRQLSLALEEIGTAGGVAQLLLSDRDAAPSILQSVVRPPSDSDESDIELAARAGALRAMQQTGAALGLGIIVGINNDHPNVRSEGAVALALAMGRHCSTARRQLYAYPAEIRRRAVLWTAEFLWFEVPRLLEASAEEVASS